MSKKEIAFDEVNRKGVYQEEDLMIVVTLDEAMTQASVRFVIGVPALRANAHRLKSSEERGVGVYHTKW